jgi:hypothetical protein
MSIVWRSGSATPPGQAARVSIDFEFVAKRADEHGRPIMSFSGRFRDIIKSDPVL